MACSLAEMVTFADVFVESTRHRSCVELNRQGTCLGYLIPAFKLAAAF